MKFSNDIWFCAYLMYRGVKVARHEVPSRGKVKCLFDLTDDQWNTYKLDFNNSEMVKFKALTEQIKDLGY